MTQLIAGVGASATIIGASGGRTYALNNLSTTPQTAIPASPGRQMITVHNPGTIDAFIAPLYVQGTGSDVQLNPTPTALGGCFRVYGNGGTVVLTGEVQKQYQVFSASGTNNPLTIVTSHV